MVSIVTGSDGERRERTMRRMKGVRTASSSLATRAFRGGHCCHIDTLTDLSGSIKAL